MQRTRIEVGAVGILESAGRGEAVREVETRAVVIWFYADGFTILGDRGFWFAAIGVLVTEVVPSDPSLRVFFDHVGPKRSRIFEMREVQRSE